MQKTTILVVEDHADTATLLKMALEREGYQVIVAENGVKGLIAARSASPGLILLDRDLPDMQGLEICKRLRKSSDVPIILVTAKGDSLERVEGLDAGADDYIPKPYEVSELMARIRVQLRRKEKKPSLLEWDALSLDDKRHEVLWNDQPLALTPKEFDLLRLFMQLPEQVLTRAQITQAVWGWESNGQDKVLDVSISSLREKIEQLSGRRLIHTVRGVGFILRQS